MPEPQAGVLTASDEQLVKCAREGDRDSLEELFRRYWGLSYRVAYRLLGHEQDALDAVQDSLYKAYVHLGAFDGRSGFRTWLLRIVRNTALDAGRRRRRRKLLRLGDSENEGPEPTVTENPASDLERSDLKRALDIALQRLSPSMRSTFVLFAEAELSYKDIAECEGVPIGTVMSRLHYVRQKLQAYLEGDSAV
ncbi:MAG TPA: sigma-70 family RNA polymerase sigma factor [Isosphaeraceae bacterium]|jgi:RNA polymerase sigma-70 factor (ECF subfamily)|nr:sigma-70 family RNA polymerase sigma factor [Isosphaeraceae bacterium]